MTLKTTLLGKSFKKKVVNLRVFMTFFLIKMDEKSCPSLEQGKTKPTKEGNHTSKQVLCLGQTTPCTGFIEESKFQINDGCNRKDAIRGV